MHVNYIGSNIFHSKESCPKDVKSKTHYYNIMVRPTVVDNSMYRNIKEFYFKKKNAKICIQI